MRLHIILSVRHVLCGPALHIRPCILGVARNKLGLSKVITRVVEIILIILSVIGPELVGFDVPFQDICISVGGCKGYVDWHS